MINRDSRAHDVDGTGSPPPHLGAGATHLYRFAPFTLDADSRVLAREGKPVALPLKAFDCIIYLVQNRHRAVGRDELIAAVWGKVDIGDNVLGQTILIARKALDDSGRGQRFIRTVTRFGYQWVAAIESATHDAAGSEISMQPPGGESTLPVKPERVRRRMPATPSIALVLVGLGIAVALVFMHLARHLTMPEAGPAASIDGILVLPAQVAEGADNADWMRLGVMAFVNEQLRIAGKTVVPAENAVALARGNGVAIDDPARLRRIAAAAGASVIVAIDIHAEHGAWRVSLRTPLSGESQPAGTAVDTDVLDAARHAIDTLTQRIGWPLPPRVARPLADDDPLLQKIRAALLEEKLSTARTLIDNASAEQRAKPAFRLAAARIDYEGGRLDAAQTAYRKLLADPVVTADATAHGETYKALGAIQLLHRDPRSALPLLDEAIRILAPAHADEQLGRAYGNRAAAHALLADYEAERADLAQARLALSTAGDRLGLLVLDANRAASEMRRDHYAEAERGLLASMDRYASFGAYAAELNARSNLALAQLALLEPEAALANDRRIVELLDKVPAGGARRIAHLVRAQILIANGRNTAAGALLEQIRREWADDAVTRARVAGFESGLALDTRDFERAERLAEEALRTPFEGDDDRERSANWLTLVRAQLARGELSAADATLVRATAWAETEKSSGAWPRITLAKAERAARANDTEAARSAFELAQEQAERNDVPVDRVTVAAAYVAWLVAQGDFAHASVVAETMAGWTERDFTAALAQLKVFHALRDPAAWRQALARTQTLAGERAIPAEFTQRKDAAEAERETNP